jgi:hypothetical protein
VSYITLTTSFTLKPAMKYFTAFCHQGMGVALTGVCYNLTLVLQRSYVGAMKQVAMINRFRGGLTQHRRVRRALSVLSFFCLVA